MGQRANRIIAWVMAPWVALIGLGWWLVLQPPMVLTDESGSVSPEVMGILARQMRVGEVCDPLPCWTEVAVQGITRLGGTEELPPEGGLPFAESEALRVSGLCPAGSHVVEAVLRDRWWNRFVPFASDRWPEGRTFRLCLPGQGGTGM